MTKSATTDLKQAAADFLQLVVAGKIDEGFRKHVDAGGKHHNAFTPAGFPALQKGMQDNHAQMPHKRLTVQNVLGDGELVAVRSRLELAPGGTVMIVVHLLRFRDGKIVEFWDCGQVVPADSPNKDGVF